MNIHECQRPDMNFHENKVNIHERQRKSWADMDDDHDGDDAMSIWIGKENDHRNRRRVSDHGGSVASDHELSSLERCSDNTEWYVNEVPNSQDSSYPDNSTLAFSGAGRARVRVERDDIERMPGGLDSWRTGQRLSGGYRSANRPVPPTCERVCLCVRTVFMHRCTCKRRRRPSTFGIGRWRSVECRTRKHLCAHAYVQAHACACADLTRTYVHCHVFDNVCESERHAKLSHCVSAQAEINDCWKSYLSPSAYVRALATHSTW